jgi:hypothetical protein
VEYENEYAFYTVLAYVKTRIDPFYVWWHLKDYLILNFKEFGGRNKLWGNLENNGMSHQYLFFLFLLLVCLFSGRLELLATLLLSVILIQII